MIVVFEGRDAAGKAGTIRANTERVSPRVFRIVALPFPIFVVFLGAVGSFLAIGIIGLFVGQIVLSVGYKLFLVRLDQGVEQLPSAAEAMTKKTNAKLVRRAGTPQWRGRLTGWARRMRSLALRDNAEKIYRG